MDGFGDVDVPLLLIYWFRTSETPSTVILLDSTVVLPVDKKESESCYPYRFNVVHAKDGEVVTHNVGRSGVIPQGDWQRLGRGFRFRIPGWGSVPWKKVITELSLIGYDYVMSYEHEDVTMSRHDGITKTIAYLKPLMIEKPYEGRNDVLFN